MSGLRGKVVIVDFWTYSCINCQRTLPHVEAWYKRYAPYGLESRWRAHAGICVRTRREQREGAVQVTRVKYPVAIDDDYGTWHAYHNNYWPAEYLIDATGIVRHVDYGEGSYSLTETAHSNASPRANPGIKLPPPTSVPKSHADGGDQSRELRWLRLRTDLLGFIDRTALERRH